jgi:hypothetical protein
LRKKCSAQFRVTKQLLSNFKQETTKIWIDTRKKLIACRSKFNRWSLKETKCFKTRK